VTKLPPLSEQEKELLLWAGLYITECSVIERDLLRLTCDALSTGSQRTAIVYLSARTIEGRLSLIDELVTCVLAETIKPRGKSHKSSMLKRWESLLKEIRQIISIRNKLAHHPRSQAAQLVNGDYTRKLYPAVSVGIPEIFRGRRVAYEARPIFASDIAANCRKISPVLKKLASFSRRFAARSTTLKPSRRLSWLSSATTKEILPT
jgi:hypothetical protein